MSPAATRAKESLLDIVERSKGQLALIGIVISGCLFIDHRMSAQESEQRALRQDVTAIRSDVTRMESKVDRVLVAFGVNGSQSVANRMREMPAAAKP